jgi:26S proteasome regulatory subunit N3
VFTILYVVQLRKNFYSSAADALTAQAIRDGVIDAELDHAAGTMSSREQANVYTTKEPQEAFHKRITFCLDVHNEAVKVSSYIF